MKGLGHGGLCAFCKNKANSMNGGVRCATVVNMKCFTSTKNTALMHTLYGDV